MQPGCAVELSQRTCRLASWKASKNLPLWRARTSLSDVHSAPLKASPIRRICCVHSKTCKQPGLHHIDGINDWWKLNSSCGGTHVCFGAAGTSCGFGWAHGVWQRCNGGCISGGFELTHPEGQWLPPGLLYSCIFCAGVDGCTCCTISHQSTHAQKLPASFQLSAHQLFVDGHDLWSRCSFALCASGPDVVRFHQGYCCRGQ